MSAWFNPTSLSPYTLAKAGAINGLMAAVQVAFDKLPDPALIQQNRIGYVVDSGAVNALAVAMPITLAGYSAGICLRVKVLNTNTGAATINVDGLGAVAIKRADGSALVGTELLAGSVVDLTYDGTVFRLPPVIVALTPGDIAAITAGLAANYEPIITPGTSSQYLRGDKVFATLDKAAVGLGNADNTSDANKPVSTAQQNALNLKLDITTAASTYLPLTGGQLSGNLGIGVSPSVRLHLLNTVSELARLQSNGGNPQLTFYQGSGSGTLLGSVEATTNGPTIVATGARNISFFTNSSERMRLDSNGNLGLGITPISSLKMQINAATDKNVGVGLNGSSLLTIGGFTDAGASAPLLLGGNPLRFSGNGGTTTHFSIDNAGVVTTVGTHSFANDTAFELYKSGTDPVFLLDTNDYWVYVRSSNTLSFNIADSAKFQVDSNGPIGITRSPGANDTYLATTAFVAAAMAALLPAGVIVAWSGSIASIPAGWALCDGTAGTPNLRDKFIIGAGSAYAVAATGGSKDAVNVSHTHTATVTDPGHQHNLPGGTSSGGTIQTQLGVNSTAQNGQSASATTGVTVGISTDGVSGTDKNLPPYYALAYIMKT